MIRTKEDLKLFISNDRKVYCDYISMKSKFRKEFYYLVFKYLKLLRKCEYFYNGQAFLRRLRYIFCSKKKIKMERKLNISVPINTIGYGPMFYHGGITINSMSKIGNFCLFHGNNCIGNKGKDTGCPEIGNNVELGWGSIVIGKVQIADNCVIGALCLVNKSFLKEKSLLIGLPAKANKE